MLFFKKKIKLVETGFFSGFTDYHNHMLPGVDDGFKTPEESLKALEYFENLGVAKINFTPHRMNGFRTTKEELEVAFRNLAETYKGKIQLSLAGEYMLDSGFEKRMQEGLHFLEDQKVLVETSFFSPPNNFQELLFSISVAGYTPVIAHPERYHYMNKFQYRQLKEKGCLLQLNLLSLTGYYGSRVESNALYLLENDAYDIAGTDIHNLEVFCNHIEKAEVTIRQSESLAKLIR